MNKLLPKIILLLASVHLLIGETDLRLEGEQRGFVKRRIAIPPMPPPVPFKSRTFNLTVPPERWINVLWDPDVDPFVTYSLNVIDKSGRISTYPAEGTRVDLVQFFKVHGIGRGWYRIEVVATDQVFLTSEPVVATVFLWHP